MKKFVYVIIGLMAIVFLVNISAASNDSKLKIEENGKILEINPLY